MRSLSFFILLFCKALGQDSYVTAEGFGDSETKDYEMFAPDDFIDRLAQSEFLPSDPLAQNDISLFTGPISSIDTSAASLSSGSDLLADSASLGCSSSEPTQDQIISKRLNPEPEEKAQSCLPQRSNPGKYPGFDPENDPLIPLKLVEPEDEEFCPRQLYFLSYLVCDSGYFVDRKVDELTGLFNLDRCQRSMILATASPLPFWSLLPCVKIFSSLKNFLFRRGKLLIIIQSTE